jgi:hypothetical protein
LIINWVHSMPSWNRIGIFLFSSPAGNPIGSAFGPGKAQSTPMRPSHCVGRIPESSPLPFCVSL